MVWLIGGKPRHRNRQRQPDDGQRGRTRGRGQVMGGKGRIHRRQNMCLTVDQRAIDIEDDKAQLAQTGSSKGSAGTSLARHSRWSHVRCI